jgi:hypothetical protein
VYRPNLALRWGVVVNIRSCDVGNETPGVEGFVVVLHRFLHLEQLFVRLTSVKVNPAEAAVKPLSLQIRLHAHVAREFQCLVRIKQTRDLSETTTPYTHWRVNYGAAHLFGSIPLAKHRKELTASDIAFQEGCIELFRKSRQRLPSNEAYHQHQQLCHYASGGSKDISALSIRRAVPEGL